ncbi:CMGC/SRPK protein kinase [Coprinopsis cinerea okayama7|uniref:CMGC/SRPK protein kinase n=1 Tax=Coprinopsis cinerea (strain Okayama-7 / 130 / ATCC MYA-4618 / FGSC 9003) TaxID=240176 RepID=A8PBS1_COPC7|nr:CMGC/SRPK protein kinase [Coprinopsis cinerea okayama7\|eukprot:XP_001840256.2 CMGC/SRPK protein kinase [Coprinopsis cinerea okayama7\
MSKAAKEDGVFVFKEDPNVFSPPGYFGYAPIKLGQRFTNLDRISPPTFALTNTTESYEVVRKLGWGQEANVWLARRYTKDNPKDSKPLYVAIRILSAVCSAYVVQGPSYELYALGWLQDTDEPAISHPGRSYCSLAKDHFLYISVHGCHLAFVFEPHSLNLQDYILREKTQNPGLQYLFSLDGIKNIIRQTLLALSYVHARQLIHTDLATDVKWSNIFLDQGNQDDAIIKYLIQNPSKAYPVRFAPGLTTEPVMEVMSQPLPLFENPSRNSLTLKLGDFGLAAPALEAKRRGPFPGTPTDLRAPELVLRSSWGAPVDIWALGCMFFDLIFSNRPPFDLRGPPGDLDAIHLARMEELLGPFPPSMRTLCREDTRDKYFDDDGSLKFKIECSMAASGNLEQQLSPLRQTFSDHDVDELIRFMRRCLTIDPASRPTADELLQDPWLSANSQDHSSES